MIHDTQSARSFSLVVTAGMFAIAALSGACDFREPRTQVMLIVDADDDVRTLVTGLQVDIEGRAAGEDAGTPSFTRTFGPMDPNDVTWPYSIPLVPHGGDAQRLYRVTATAYAGADKIAVLRSESGFIARKTIELRLRFEASCLRAKSLDCPVSETCDKGACVPARIDEGVLPKYTGGRDVVALDGGPATGTTTEPNTGLGGAGGAPGSAGRMAAGSGGAGTGVTQGGAGAPIGDPSVPGDCGDGKLSGDETCDTAIGAGQPGACPILGALRRLRVSRHISKAVVVDTRCTPRTITVLESGDGCCPVGADANSDTDCGSRCDNGSIETGEACDPIATCPTPLTCVSANACLKATIVGDPTACNATCQMQPIVECVSGDGCCPSACTRANDMDCSATCGDGVIDFGEVCEQNTARPCPASCNDNDACTVDLFTGSVNNCNSACTEVLISNPFNDDGCCPTGGNANNDNDCQPMCGNRTVERGEKCDGNCPTAANCDDGDPCTIDGLTGSGCTVSCTHTRVTDPALAPDGCCVAGANANTDGDCQPACGNGVKEAGEECDGNCPTAQSCDDNQACTRDTITGSGCGRVCTHATIGPNPTTADGVCCPAGSNSSVDADCAPAPAVCGNGKTEPGEDCDGADCPACKDADDCTLDQVTPNPDACHPKCEHVPIGPDRTKADGVCCPAGSDSRMDPDCPPPTPMCGNGTLEGNEVCDPPQVACPPCVPSSTCSRAVVGGTACNPTCMQETISLPTPNDGCCPLGANANNDPECLPVCGNGVREGSEACDGADVSSGSTCGPMCTIEGLLPP